MGASSTVGAQPVRWGLVGASTMALTWVGPAIQLVGGHVVGIASGSVTRAREVAAALGGAAVYSSLGELLADPTIDAVYISSTNDRHAAQAIAAAGAGKAILCEKPLARSVQEGEAMLEAAAANGVLLATNHHLRSAPAHRTLRDLVANGQFGRIVAARVHHAMCLPAQWHGWRLQAVEAGAGVALDLTVHSSDLLRFLLDDEVVEVRALSAQQGMAAAGIEDALMTVMRFSGGALAYCHDAFTVPHASSAVELFGSDASALVPNGMSGRLANRVVLRRGEREETMDCGAIENPYAPGIRRFHDALEHRSTPFATGEDGLKALRIALTARDSAKEHASMDAEAGRSLAAPRSADRSLA